MRSVKSEAWKSIVAGIQMVILGTLFVLVVRTCVNVIDAPVYNTDLTQEQRAEVIGRLIQK